MTETLFSAMELADEADALAGYRLHRIEVFNWGTFDRSVWDLRLEGRTSLLTGDIGSGKSTLVDAITTLLLPANRISYNKAAGADVKERNLRSYVEGHYRSERNEATGASRPVGLRDHRSYSVILGRFENTGFDETVTIAQVFHQQDRAGQPDRFFVTASSALSIEPDFSGFGGDLKTLRSRLRTAGADIDTVFPEYQRKLRRLLGIRSEQAMDLFHQTVSMKSVGNLNDFVRSHMLEPVDAADRVRAIVDHFENLTRAHEAVRRATDQLALLDPLVGAADRYDAAQERYRIGQAERDAVLPYAAEAALTLLERAIDARVAELDELGRRSDVLAERRRALQPERERLIARRAGVGGDRLRALDAELPGAAGRVDMVGERRAYLHAALQRADLAGVDDEPAFVSRVAEVQAAHRAIAAAKARIEAAIEPLRERRGEVRRRRADLEREIAALDAQGSNLPAGLVPLRERLCDALRLDAERLPFVAELLDVAVDAASWRGAAERVLRPFALNLLVPQAEYSRVNQWVNDHDVRTRLVYLRVADRRVRVLPLDPAGGQRLVDVVEVEPGPFAGFLAGELVQRADHRLVEDVEMLERESRAVTREGLVRDRDRHEKDDRPGASDPGRWVLGRRTEQKRAVLDGERSVLTAEATDLEVALSDAAKEQEALDDRRAALAAVAEYRSWAEVDVEGARAGLARLEQERERLIAGSSELAEIDLRIAEVDSEESEIEQARQQLSERTGRVGHERDGFVRRSERDRRLLADLGDTVLDLARAHYPALAARAGRAAPTTVEEVDDLRDRLTRAVTTAIESAQREAAGYTTSIQSQMNEVLRRWPELRGEMDASVGSIGDFRALHDRVNRDDLPRFEAEFKTQLDTNAMRELAAFQTWLIRQSEEIRSRVDRINEALGAIDYNPGRRIELLPEPTVNQEVRQFRADLREATSDLLAEDQGDAEARFERVRTVIERFQGRPGFTDADRAWTRRVTDVRTWFTFAGSELDKQTGVEYEHYTDSDGKSGGQKEKLAYTILAASLAYQFGLQWGAAKSRDFRFAVIDEAFGRGSDGSTRFALDLFEKLGLQLLIVTPLQKVHIIEPYVHAIGFVDNPTGSASRVRTLTIEEFRQGRDEVGR